MIRYFTLTHDITLTRRQLQRHMIVCHGTSDAAHEHIAKGSTWRLRKEHRGWHRKYAGCNGHPYRLSWLFFALDRFQFIPFWKVTRWGTHWNYMFGRVLKINEGCDEWHNMSHFMIVPMVGEFVWFEKGMSRNGPRHLYAYSNGVWEGADYSGPRGHCPICEEIKADEFHLLPERVEEVRQWYHVHLPGGMGGDWLAEAKRLRDTDPERAAMMQDIADVTIFGPGLHEPLGGSCTYCQATWKGRRSTTS